MSLVSCMDLKFMNTICVEITSITSQLYRVRHIHKVKLPLVVGPTLHDVVDKLELLQVFVCLAVQLEVSLEVGLVGAEFTDVGSTNH